MSRNWYVFGVLAVLSAPGLFVLGYRILDRPPPPPADLVIAGLHPAIKVSGARRPSGEPFCNKVVHCGSLVAVSCQPETDGSLEYYNNTDGTLVMRCGGACLGGRGSLGSKVCEACPPAEWTCEKITPN
jgi:hypothetical protein